MATLTLNLTEAQMIHLFEAGSLTGQGAASYILDLIDEDAMAKLHSLQDAEALLGSEIPPAFAGLDDLLNKATAIGSGARRSAAPIAPGTT